MLDQTACTHGAAVDLSLIASTIEMDRLARLQYDALQTEKARALAGLAEAITTPFMDASRTLFDLTSRSSPMGQALAELGARVAASQKNRSEIDKLVDQVCDSFRIRTDNILSRQAEQLGASIRASIDSMGAAFGGQLRDSFALFTAEQQRAISDAVRSAPLLDLGNLCAAIASAAETAVVPVEQVEVRGGLAPANERRRIICTALVMLALLLACYWRHPNSDGTFDWDVANCLFGHALAVLGLYVSLQDGAVLREIRDRPAPN